MSDLLHTRIAHLLAIAASALLLLAGCGGDDDGDGGNGGGEAAETQPQTTPETTPAPAPDDDAAAGGGDAAAAEQTVQEYIDSLVEGDGAKLCDLLSASEREEVDTFSGEQGCAGFFDEFLQLVSEERKNELRAADPQVEVDGNRATAKIPSVEGDGEDTVNLRKEGGEWKIGEIDEPGEGP